FGPHRHAMHLKREIGVAVAEPELVHGAVQCDADGFPRLQRAPEALRLGIRETDLRGAAAVRGRAADHHHMNPPPPAPPPPPPPPPPRREPAAGPGMPGPKVAPNIAPGPQGPGAPHAIWPHAAALGVVPAARAIRRLSVFPEGPRRHLLAAVAAVAARAAGPAGAGHHAAVARPAAGLPAAETAGTHAAAGLEDLLHLRREVAEHVLPHVLHRAAAESTHAGCIATVLA